MDVIPGKLIFPKPLASRLGAVDDLAGPARSPMINRSSSYKHVGELALKWMRDLNGSDAEDDRDRNDVCLPTAIPRKSVMSPCSQGPTSCSPHNTTSHGRESEG